jgi:pimeloyl-ACP methyl ester carboxylesterase
LSKLDPQLVFIHGAGSNADFWHEQHGAFPSAHYLNLPGHQSLLPLQVQSPRSKAQGSRGQTSIPTSSSEHSSEVAIHLPGSDSQSGISYWIEDYASWVESYIGEHGLSEVILNGHSMGGAIALTLALRQHGWLRGLVLTGTGARLRVSPELLHLLRTDYPAAVEMIVQQSLPPLQEPLTYKQRIRRNGIRRHILRTPQCVTLNDYEACDRFDVMAHMGRIAVPTLCIVGSQDRMTPPKYSDYLYSRITGSQLAIVEGAGHMLPLEKPEEYNRCMLEFLRAS